MLFSEKAASQLFKLILSFHLLFWETYRIFKILFELL